MIVVFGSTGNTGKVAVESLVRQGEPVRAVGRNREKLQPLADLGAEPWTTDLEDGGAVARALEGARAAYLLIPPNLGVDDFVAYQGRVIEALVHGVTKARIGHVVVLSSLGADHAQGTGPIVGLYRLEQALRSVQGLASCFVRAGFFMENFLLNLGLIKAQGINGSAAPPDAPMELIATADIGRYAAERLAASDFSGSSVVNLVAPRPYTMREATAVLGAAIDRPDLPYVQFGYTELEQGLLSMGLKPQMAGLYVEMYRGAAQGLLSPEPGTQTVRAATSLEVFGPVFGAIYQTSPGG
jgi:uncharacterized protein YbjT (DUF2867 family)